MLGYGEPLLHDARRRREMSGSLRLRSQELRRQAVELRDICIKLHRRQQFQRLHEPHAPRSARDAKADTAAREAVGNRCYGDAVSLPSVIIATAQKLRDKAHSIQLWSLEVRSRSVQLRSEICERQ